MMGIALSNFDVVVWDSDRVLNCDIVDGRFVWAGIFEAGIGHSFKPSQSSIFDGPIKEVIVGRIDLSTPSGNGSTMSAMMDGSAQDILDYWFKKDDLADQESLRHLDAVCRAGPGNVIATDNETRQARYIEHRMGFGTCVERFFASRRMGIAKPNPACIATSDHERQ